MKTEGLFLVEIKYNERTKQEVLKTITDIELPDTVDQILEKTPEIIRQLGARVQQIYFTSGKVKLGGKTPRQGLEQTSLMFDIDYVIQDKKEEYISIFCEHFKLDREKTGIVDSGYGLQFHVMFENAANEKDFKECGDFFRTQVRLLELAFEDRGLIGEFDVHTGKIKTHIDTAVYRLASLARMPGTVNHAAKKQREMRRTKLVQAKVCPQAESLRALLQIDLGGDLSDSKVERSVSVDGEYVKKNCGLLRWAFEKPEELHEKDFYLTIGLLKACYQVEKEGEEACLSYFRDLQKVTKSPTLSSYSERRALEKIIRAKPAAYIKIDQHGDWCKNDPGRPHNKHPLQMRSHEFLQKLAQASGFHTLKISKSGAETYVPDYESLRVFFELKHSYISCNEVCWVFNNKFFARFEKDYLKNFAQKHFNPVADTAMVSEFTNLVLRTNLVRPEDWAINAEHNTNFNNGVLNIDSGVFTPHDAQQTTKKFLFKASLPYDYDKNATAPLFDKFMDDVTRGVSEFKQNALEYFGYSIAGDPIWLAQTLLLLGPDGAGGKSTTLNIIKKVVGSGFYSTLSLEDLNDPQARAMLEGKYFNVFGETESSKYMQSKVWKALTTGEEVTIKNVFEKPYSIKSRAKMMFASNHVPKSNDTSDAFMRRWLVIPFTRNFIEEGIADPFIEKKLTAELPGIFNTLVEAYKRLKVRGSFEIGPESRKVFEAFKQEVDPFRQWFEDNITDISKTEKEWGGKFVPTKDLFQSFKQFCEDENLKIAYNTMTGRLFTSKMIKMLGEARRVKRRGASGDSAWGFVGLKICLES